MHWNELWDKSELPKLEVIAFGCNRHARSELGRIFKDSGIFTFDILEYFLLTPIPRSDDGVRLAAERDLQTFFPFLRRTIFSSRFLAPPMAHSGSVSLAPVTRERIDEYSSVAQTEQGTLDQWRLSLKLSEVGIHVLEGFLAADGTGLPAEEAPFARVYDRREWLRYERSLSAKAASVREKAVLRAEFNLLFRLWMEAPDEAKTTVIGYPIASDDVYYGHFIVVWPGGTGRIVDGGLKTVCTALKDLVVNRYQPTLALAHNSRFERYVAKQTNGEAVGEALNVLPVFDWPAQPKDVIERGIRSLWDKRRIIFHRGRDVERLKESFLFAKYNFASPGMIAAVKKVISAAEAIRQPRSGSGDSLPAALVYGEPGAGKDTMARLIPLFTQLAEPEGDSPRGYCGITPVVLNMASLKPNAIVGPLLLGARPTVRNQTELEGLLTLASDERRERASQGAKPTDLNGEATPSVFILDELMDICISNAIYWLVSIHREATGHGTTEGIWEGAGTAAAASDAIAG